MAKKKETKEEVRGSRRFVQQALRQGMGSLKERVPSGEQVRARAADAQAWAVQAVKDHPVTAGLGGLALGFVAASLLPATRQERRAYAHAADKAREVAKALDVGGQLEDLLAKAKEVAITTATQQLVAGAEPDLDGGSRNKKKKAGPSAKSRKKRS
jgi:hypothetical protein